MVPSHDVPTWVGQVDRLDLPIADLAVEDRFGAARLLVTAAGAVAGLVTVPLAGGSVSGADLERAVTAQLGEPADLDPPPSSVEPLTIVVATRGRAESLTRCLVAILKGDHPDITVLVVDNDPTDEATADAVRGIGDPRVVYLREARRGASVGRNRGLYETVTPIVAFVDDDTEPDVAWARRVSGAFAARPSLDCVSGPVLAASLATPEEWAAENALVWNKGFERRYFSLAEPPPDSAIFPFSPGLFGIGANVAMRTEQARRVGGFDEALGPGTASLAGEDCEFFVRMVLAGMEIGYEPSAYVWHHHRPSPEALRQQMRGYAIGLGAFLGKVALDRRGRADALRRLPAALAQLRHIAAREADAGARPSGARRERLLGLVQGPAEYVRARRAVRTAGGRVAPLTRPDP